MSAPSVGRGNEEQLTPPVTKNQSLADILNEIESRANAATPGPWAPDWGRVRGDQCEDVCYFPSTQSFDAQPWLSNKAFIASARTDVVKLVKALLEALKVAKTMPAMAYERITDDCLVDALPNDLQCDYDFLEQNVAAILTSPENGEEKEI